MFIASNLSKGIVLSISTESGSTLQPFYQAVQQHMQEEFVGISTEGYPVRNKATGECFTSVSQFKDNEEVVVCPRNELYTGNCS